MDSTTLEMAGHQFVWGQRTYIMGIINVTPDSFSSDGLMQDDGDVVKQAVAQARRFVDEGADILDVGGESTRPGAKPVTVEEELQRVVPVTAAMACEVDRPISVDTYHAQVAAAALDAGAHLVNDIWGLHTPDGAWNQPLAKLVADRHVPIILMHNRRAQATAGALGSHYTAIEYQDLLNHIVTGLRESIDFAQSCGIPRRAMIVDPGIGFGKTPEQNISIMRQLHKLRSLKHPILLGASRKSFIGLTLNLPTHERDEGTVATTVLAVQAGVDIVRVHNVQMNVRAARMADVIVRPL
ncbi:MAG: dihydropteroate synthase [Chloroflexi bacterium AL-W]|nr:dihydropteroate synthase [Chloroflexi bacterium AL-N1]NOK64549.1 dihydropteroate synthase [Chloroflexi bacterium AL-N10]NOK75791.1 dihydropteroate synthase [Chloroflexi bacterium AL-N5]NOK80450.1 dihydropteroate synthase [Chloroflexi bacterium AL-W]NOK86964.1 dihydropteroate synthase [Chloroflexi bacterium AL-N15]